MSAQLVGTCGHVGCSARGNVGTDARFSEEARAGLRVRQVGAYLDVVLFGDEQWVSLLAFQSAVPRKWTVAEEGLFREVGERVKSAIERARTEEQVRELNETLETRVAGRTADLARTWNNSRDLLTILGAEGVLRAASPAWLSILGYPETEVIGRHFSDFIHPDDLQPAPLALGSAVQNGSPFFYAGRMPPPPT